VRRFWPAASRQSCAFESLWNSFEANLNQIIRISAARRIKLVLLTRPYTGTSPSPWWWKNFAPQYNATTLEVARRAGVPAIDVYSIFKNCTACFVDESHFTEKAMRQMADLRKDPARRASCPGSFTVSADESGARGDPFRDWATSPSPSTLRPTSCAWPKAS